MRKIKLLSSLFFLPVLIKSQDSIKLVHHEIGFNTVSLVKQVISNNPTSALPQLPYDFFYNAYYKDKFGIRLGAGLSTSYTETEIQNQPYPRITNKFTINTRGGLSYNFIHNKRITLNVFADYVRSDTKDETIATTTVQTFPNPTQRITTETSDKSTAEGAQAGVGIKFNIYKHLSLYTEAPLSYTTKVSKSTVNINDTGTNSWSVSTVRTSGLLFYIPTTIYLVLRF
jgi:hypothetical protein